MGESDETRVRNVRTAIFLVAWFAFILALIGLTVRYAPIVNHTELLIAAVSPYLMLVALVAAWLLFRTGKKRLAALALVPLAVGIGVNAPYFLPDSHPDRATIPIRVLTINLRNGAAQPAAVAAAARKHADVLLVQELPTDEADSLLEQSEFAADFRYTALDSRPNAAGVGIFSRYPIVQNSRLTRYQLGALTATIRPPGGAPDVVVASLHLSGPWPQSLDRWRQEIEGLPQTLEQLAMATGPGAVIVGGDFNATADLLPFRRLLDTGFSDAVEQSGGGLNRTYPADSWIPPLIGIDHILTYNGWATDSYQVSVAGTDHLGLCATIHVPA